MKSMNIPDASRFLSKEQQKMLLTRDDFKGLATVLYVWFWICVAFAISYFYPHVLTFVLAVFILGGQQLACSVIMHDTSHKSLFKTSWMNDFFGRWLGGFPVLSDMLRYRPYHVKHHVHTGLEDDPDINLVTGYPAGKKSLMRKISRDLSGITGVKTTIAVFMMHLDYLEFDQGNNPQKIDQSGRSWGKFFSTAFHNLKGPVIANVLLFLILSLFDPRLYLLWIVAYFTTFQFCVRVRSIAEHSMVDDRQNPYVNTRTTYANWLEKMLFAPLNVNYHLEHHMLMGVPCYNLPKMHRLIKEEGFYNNGTLANGYWEILKKASLAKA